MMAFFGNMGMNCGTGKPEILPITQVCMRLFLNNLSPIFGK
jgi:hypothetical protein